jgi:hypothetical protein
MSLVCTGQRYQYDDGLQNVAVPRCLKRVVPPAMSNGRLTVLSAAAFKSRCVEALIGRLHLRNAFASYGTVRYIVALV